jgi:plasmid maintenance system killer protein
MKAYRIFTRRVIRRVFKLTIGKKMRMQLVALDMATVIDDIDLPGFRLHLVKGNMKGLWSIDVNKNWRITLKFKAGDVYVFTPRITTNEYVKPTTPPVNLYRKFIESL